MKLYLVQHGEARSKAEDPERPLNDTGKRHVEAVAEWLGNHQAGAVQIYHSGKLRALQTAEIFARTLQVPTAPEYLSGLDPDADVQPVADWLANRHRDPVMMIGHLPFLSRLVGKLVVGDADREVVQFRNAGIVCLENRDGHWSVSWIFLPEFTALSSQQ